jgi:hypothetical protein
VQHGGEVAEMSLQVRTIYQDVIKEHKDEVAQIIFENIIHQGLKGSWCVGQTERHDEIFEMTTESAKCYLVNVLGPHPNLVVPRPKIQLGKDLCTMQFIKKVLDDRNRKLIFDGLRIELAEIDTEALRTIFLVDKYNWRRISTLASSDEFLGQ